MRIKQEYSHIAYSSPYSSFSVALTKDVIRKEDVPEFLWGNDCSGLVAGHSGEGCFASKPGSLSSEINRKSKR